MLISSSCLAETAEEIALKYAAEYSSLNYQAAAQMIYCSADMDKNKAQNKQARLAKDMAFLVSELGKVEKYQIIKKGLAASIALSCAPFAYRKAHPAETTIWLEVLYANNTAGLIKLRFIKVENEFMLLLADHGIQLQGRPTMDKMLEIYKRMRKLPHNLKP